MNKWSKPVIGFVGFVIVCAISFVIRGQSETLYDYAQKEPSLAYANKIDQQENTTTTKTASTNEQSNKHSAETEDTNMTNDTRVTYNKDFYFEPLSSDIINRIKNSSYTEDCPVSIDDLRYVHVLHVNFKGNTNIGELICNKYIAHDIVEIFYELYQSNYQIEQIHFVDDYSADTLLSMQDNNSFCFAKQNSTEQSELCIHNSGLGIDINPFFNPYVEYANNKEYIYPQGSEFYLDRSKNFAFKIDENDLAYKLFTSHGFTWGGHWNNAKAYSHFEKKITVETN